MRVSVNELQEGCILSADLFSRTNRPILIKKTVLTASHIEVLRAFLIREVEVERTLVDGRRFTPESNDESGAEKRIDGPELCFTDRFLQATSQYKKEFSSWQSGLPIDIGKIRALLLPLLENMDESTAEIFSLHQLSTKDTYHFQHPVAVGIISGLIGKKLEYSKGEWLQLALAGCLADSGMAKINPSILSKKTALTAKEYEEVKKHSVFSYKMVQDVSILRKDAKVAILQHHERIDGSGYPLQSKSIHPYAKIIAIADTFHAMTSERPYRSKQSPFKALEMIFEHSFGKFDLDLVRPISSLILNLSTGDIVKLSNGQTAEVVFSNSQAPTRPMVKLLETDDILELERIRTIHIEEIIH